MVAENKMSELRLATINSNTLSSEIKRGQIVNECEFYKLDVTFIQESRMTGKGTNEYGKYRMIHSGYATKREAGVAFVISPKVELVDIFFENASERLLMILVVINGNRLAMINGYAPTDTVTTKSSTKQKFYKDLQKLVALAPKIGS